MRGNNNAPQKVEDLNAVNKLTSINIANLRMIIFDSYNFEKEARQNKKSFGPSASDVRRQRSF